MAEGDAAPRRDGGRQARGKGAEGIAAALRGIEGRFPLKLFFLLVAALGLGGCKPKDLVTGSPEPPASFGVLASGSGCPKIAGVYAWPPVEGAPQGYGEGGIPDPRKYPDFFGTGAQWEGSFQVQGPDANKQLRISSRPDTTRFSKRYFDHNYKCGDGWLTLAEVSHGSLDARKEHGGPVSMHVKLATLANGDLAIGQAMRLDGGKRSLFPWGDSGSRGNWIPVADRVTWYWSRYRRVAP